MSSVRPGQLYFSQVKCTVDGLALVKSKYWTLCHLVNAAALRPRWSGRQGRSCPLSASVKFQQIALSGLVQMEKYRWCESQLVDCGTIPQQSKQSSAVFSKEVHMEGDSLCLPAAVALLRPWLNGSVAICSGPRHSERKKFLQLPYLQCLSASESTCCTRWQETAPLPPPHTHTLCCSLTHDYIFYACDHLGWRS